MNAELITLLVAVLTFITALIIGLLQLKSAKSAERIERLLEDQQRMSDEILEIKQRYKTTLNDWLFLYEVENNFLSELAKSNKQSVEGLKRKHRKPIKDNGRNFLLNKDKVNKELETLKI